MSYIFNPTASTPLRGDLSPGPFSRDSGIKGTRWNHEFGRDLRLGPRRYSKGAAAPSTTASADLQTSMIDSLKQMSGWVSLKLLGVLDQVVRVLAGGEDREGLMNKPDQSPFAIP